MARKPVALPEGVEIVGSTIRIRFTWGTRRCETLDLPATATGIAAASNLRSRVKQLIKLNGMTDEKYLEFFPKTSYLLPKLVPLFGEYAQTWLNSLDIVDSTRRNYRSTLNNYWMPHLGGTRIDEISATDIRNIVAKTKWRSPGVRRAARDILASVFETAMIDGLLKVNPVKAIKRQRLQQRIVDPLTREEAERLVSHLYETLVGSLRIYAAYFEFALFTGMRPGEIMGLRWDEVDEVAGTVHVCRLVVDGEIVVRVKTKKNRFVLLNDRARNALREAAVLTRHRSRHVFAPTVMNGDSDWIRSESTPKEYFLPALAALGIRRRRQYDCRHTYATMCIMSGMNVAFIANQLGHSVQMLLTTYAKWINSGMDVAEMQKLNAQPIGTELVRAI
ncbi:site-specific integrase [Pseudomonas sp. PDM13]|uniref:site-specific integrase n=1 Tax=Pseudomonas sp. PDM13 TaxID=2769255 RepID=UPI0021E0234D|nr:site-specific integrase [Pseudomonas sp. PDM13]MCU9947560.1 site-specific integrase [Pseudomonas sp. PDM13]